MAAQVNYPVAPVTAATHKYTYNCHFDGEDCVGLVTMDGFRNLLDAHIGTLNKAKQVSYTRNRAWLDAIRDGNTTPPAGYAGNQASWKNEIGATNPATSKWIVEDGHVYKKTKNAKEGGPMTPTEGIYEFMTRIHLTNGHKGRDNFFNLVKSHSGSIKKAFCHQFVQVCCEKAESWQAGGSVPYGWQAPVKHRKAGRNNAVDNDNDKDIDDGAVVDNMNAAANVQLPPTPQATPDADEQFGSINVNIDFDELNAQIADDWDIEQPNFYQRYTPPPSPQDFGLEQGANSYFPADQNPFGGYYAAVGPQYPVYVQYLVQDQYAAADLQYAVDFQYPVHDAGIEPLLSESDINNFIQNNPELFQQVEGGMQMQMQGAQQIDFNNHDQFYFAGQEAPAAPYYPELEQHDQIMSNDEMIVEQHNQEMVDNDMTIDQNNQIMDNDEMVVDENSQSMYNDDMVIEKNGQIMYNNQMVVDAFGNPQIPPMLDDGYSMQQVEHDQNSPSSGLDFAHMEADTLFGVNMDLSLNDSQ